MWMLTNRYLLELENTISNSEGGHICFAKTSVVLKKRTVAEVGHCYGAATCLQNRQDLLNEVSMMLPFCTVRWFDLLFYRWIQYMPRFIHSNSLACLGTVV